MHCVTLFVTTRDSIAPHVRTYKVGYASRLYRWIYYSSSSTTGHLSKVRATVINVSTCNRTSVIQPFGKPHRQPMLVDFQTETRNERPINNRPIVNQLTNVVSKGAESGCSWRDNGRSKGLVWRKTKGWVGGTSGRGRQRQRKETVARMAVKKRSSKGDDTRRDI